MEEEGESAETCGVAPDLDHLRSLGSDVTGHLPAWRKLVERVRLSLEEEVAA